MAILLASVKCYSGKWGSRDTIPARASAVSASVTQFVAILLILQHSFLHQYLMLLVNLYRDQKPTLRLFDRSRE
jgi:hypothetical protein